MKKGNAKKSMKKSRPSTSVFVVGLILGIIVGLLIGGSINLTGNVVEDLCDPSCIEGETCTGGVCIPDESGQNTPPIQPTGECTSDPECVSLYGAGYTCDVAMGYCSETDNDFDGYGVATDCNDNDANVYPGNWEQCGDSIDNDCDSSTLDTCAVGETCSAGTCMPEEANTPPIQTTGECTSTPDCDALYPGMGYICETEYCMPDPNANTPPI